MSKQAEKIIKEEYGESTNFMTPNVISYHMAGPDLAAELSSGAGLLSDGVVYGVSVVRQTETGTERRTDLSKLFQSKQEALAYIDELSR